MNDEPEAVLPSASRFTPGNVIAAAVVLMIVAAMLRDIATNENFGWDIVLQYFTSTAILRGLVTTLMLALLGITIGSTVGTLVAVMRLSANPVLSSLAAAWVWFFRGTPLLVQLIFWFNLSALYPTISLGIPFGPDLVSANANALITPLTAALLGLGLMESGYMAEIIRGGILGVDQEQVDASKALGMPRRTRFFRVIFPQAVRLILPATGNRAISQLKDTALVSVIAMPDLLYTAQIIYSNNYQTIPLLVVAALWYLIVVTVLTLGQRAIERVLAKGPSLKSLS